MAYRSYPAIRMALSSARTTQRLNRGVVLSIGMGNWLAIATMLVLAEKLARQEHRFFSECVFGQ